MTDEARVKRNFNEREKMSVRDRPQRHITAGNWLLPEACRLKKISEPVFKTSQFPLLNLRKQKKNPEKNNISGHLNKSEEDGHIFMFQHKLTQR